jgi:hypothetical protein
MNSVGQAVVAWIENDGGSGACTLRAQAFLTGSGWATPTSIDSSAIVGDCGIDLDVALNASGDAVATWIRTLPATGQPDIFAYRGVLATRSWTGPTLVGNGNPEGVAWGSVTIAGNGQAIAVWEQSETVPPPGSFRLNLWSNLFR